MKRLLTAFTITLVAAVWMIGTWLFFNSIAAGAPVIISFGSKCRSRPYKINDLPSQFQNPVVAA